MGYKAFYKGLICRHDGHVKQYAENTDFEEKGANACCNEGVMHYCEEPMDCLDYYPLVDENGDITEFAEVEPLGEVLKDGNKRATNKLHIGAKLSLKGFIEAAVNVIVEKTKPEKIDGTGGLNDNGEMAARIVSSGDDAQIGSSGDTARIGSSGRYAQIGSSGDDAQIGSSGYAAQIGSAGRYAQIGSSGDAARIVSSGDTARIGSSGRYAQIGSSGYAAQIGSSGRYAQIGSSGDDARIKCEAEHAVVACVGKGAMIKATLGAWVTLAEYGDYDGYGFPCTCLKSAQIDGKTLKPDTWYKLEKGEFVEVAE